MAEPSIKPIGFKPDGSHINKGALALVVCILIGLYCIYSDAPFGHPKVTETPIPVVTKDMGDK
jgi:hypothetical protein